MGTHVGSYNFKTRSQSVSEKSPLSPPGRLIISHKSGMPLKAIPKGLCPPAQGCDPALSDNPCPLIQPKCLQCATAVLYPCPERAGELPWDIVQTASQPQRGCGRARHPRTQSRWGWFVLTRWTQGSSLLATLGFVAESFQDSHDCLPEMWVVMNRKERDGEGRGRGHFLTHTRRSSLIFRHALRLARYRLVTARRLRRTCRNLTLTGSVEPANDIDR